MSTERRTVAAIAALQMTLGIVLRVLVADDHALVRHGFRSILAGEDDIEVIKEADTGTTPWQLRPKSSPMLC